MDQFSPDCAARPMSDLDLLAHSILAQWRSHRHTVCGLQQRSFALRICATSLREEGQGGSWEGRAGALKASARAASALHDRNLNLTQSLVDRQQDCVGLVSSKPGAAEHWRSLALRVPSQTYAGGAGWWGHAALCER
jgi:hypothetical protein